MQNLWTVMLCIMASESGPEVEVYLAVFFFTSGHVMLALWDSQGRPCKVEQCAI